MDAEEMFGALLDEVKRLTERASDLNEKRQALWGEVAQLKAENANLRERIRVLEEPDGSSKTK